MLNSSVPATAPPLDAFSAPLPFVCRWKPDGFGSAWIHLEGDLDLANLDSLRRVLADAQASATAVSIDLQGLAFIDCSAVHFLFEAAKASRALQRRLVLIRGSGQVDRLLRLVAACNWVEIVDLYPGDPRADGVR